MLKGYHVLDGHNPLHSYQQYPIKPKDIATIDHRFDDLYHRLEKHGIELKSELAIVLGDWRKFDPDYDPDELFKAIIEEGRQGREFKVRFTGLGQNEMMYPVK